MFFKTTATFLIAFLSYHVSASRFKYSYPQTSTCQRTTVVVLGAGMAGITAAQTLSDASVTDFLIVEYNGDIGGRVAHTTFGNDSEGKPYTVELGANWVQGLDSHGGPENPIWTLAKKYGLVNTYSNYSSILTYNASGYANYTALLDDFKDNYAVPEQDAGKILTQNLQDRSYRAGLSIAGWKPGQDTNAQAVEWWAFDWEYSYPPEQSSEEFGIINYNTTFYQFSDENTYVWDQRGFNTLIKGMASEFLTANDSRLRLNTIVTDIDYSASDTVTVSMADGSCISAAYAICTFSLGVLQASPPLATFTPPLPKWKQTAINSMQMGTYTKLFLQFSPAQQFWDADVQFFLYADPVTRGYYPIFQSLSSPDFLSGSGILFATIVHTQSYKVEKQSDEETLAQILEVLYTMFGRANVPDPIAFMYPRWSTVPWAMGSYSNWPAGLTLEGHQNLRANVGRLYFAGEALSAQYYGFLQGAYFEGVYTAEHIGRCLGGARLDCRSCEAEVIYDPVVPGAPVVDLNAGNGWFVDSLLSYR